MKQTYINLLGGFVLLIFCSGCLTTQCRLSVSNVSEMDLQSVTIEPNGRLPYSFKDLDADSFGESVPVDADLQSPIVVRWTDTDGESYAKTFSSDGVVSHKYDGRVIFQVVSKENVKMFLEPNRRDRGSDQPWAIPAEWEGAPGIPGLSQ